MTVYTDITRAKRSEELLCARSEELSDQVLAHAEELSATNRELAATITALEEAKRQLTAMEARTRLTTEMMPAHIAHVDAQGHYTYSNRRLSAVLPGSPSDIVGMHMSEALEPGSFAKVEPHLNAAYAGHSPVFEFTEDHDSRRIRVALTPDGQGGSISDVDGHHRGDQARWPCTDRRRALAAQMTSGLAHDFSTF